MDIRILSFILKQRERDEFNLTRFIMQYVIRIYVSELCTVRCDKSARLQIDWRAIRIESISTQLLRKDRIIICNIYVLAYVYIFPMIN